MLLKYKLRILGSFHRKMVQQEKKVVAPSFSIHTYLQYWVGREETEKKADSLGDGAGEPAAYFL